MTGHCLAASGSIESVASVLELKQQFLFPNVNLNEVHPEILKHISESRIPKKKTPLAFNYLAKASFGFGDVNCCLIFKSF